MNIILCLVVNILPFLYHSYHYTFSYEILTCKPVLVQTTTILEINSLIRNEHTISYCDTFFHKVYSYDRSQIKNYMESNPVKLFYTWSNGTVYETRMICYMLISFLLVMFTVFHYTLYSYYQQEVERHQRMGTSPHSSDKSKIS